MQHRSMSCKIIFYPLLLLEVNGNYTSSSTYHCQLLFRVQNIFNRWYLSCIVSFRSVGTNFSNDSTYYSQFLITVHHFCERYYLQQLLTEQS